MAEDNSVTVYMKVYLQRLTEGGTWTTIDSDTTTNRFAEVTGTVNDAGTEQVVLSFTGTTLDWDETAQYRIMVEKDASIQGNGSLGSSEVRVYSVSTA